jgi:DNA ligase-1
VTNDHGHVARVARDEGADGLAGQSLSVGRPVQAMLAQAGTVTGALEDWDAAAVETKFDGARVQVHHDGDGTRLFSRNMEAVTDALPEVVAFVERTLDTQAILDGEVVAVDDAGDPLPFQAVLRRFRRKHDVAAAREDVELRLHVFDCLHADGEDLLDAPLTERHDRLVDLLGPSDDDADRERDPGGGVSELRILEDTDAVADVEAAALDAGHEGIMLKRPDSTYTPGRRGRNWRKRKPDVETLDCVVVGAEWGEGRRAEQFGTFLLGVRDGEGYETVGKVATGVTDEELAALTERLEPHVRTQDGKTVELAPAVVFEVGYEEIQRSPTYSAGHALRFPRFLGVREDRTPANADTLDRVERLAADD